MTGESFYNNPSSLQSDWGVTLQWESICIITPGPPGIIFVPCRSSVKGFPRAQQHLWGIVVVPNMY